MKPLTIDKAVLLYEILGAHVPEFDETYEEDVLKFIGKIVSNISQSGQHRDYVDAVMLMSGKGWEEIGKMELEYVLDLFVNGLVDNKIVRLKSFFDTVGYKHA